MSTIATVLDMCKKDDDIPNHTMTIDDTYWYTKREVVVNNPKYNYWKSLNININDKLLYENKETPFEFVKRQNALFFGRAKCPLMVYVPQANRLLHVN
jgi:hypothetical protein